MYTFSIRPYCPYGPPKRSVNFTQDNESWTLSTFRREEQAHGTSFNFGLSFYSPLQSVDISVKQLASLIAGIDAAYEELCTALYKDAAKDLANTPWKNRKTFMECVPRGLFEEKPDVTRTVFAADVEPIPVLYDSEANKCLGWNGFTWGLFDPVDAMSTYDSAGTCFGWQVLYKESVMNTDCVRDPSKLAYVVCVLLETLAYLNSEEKVYVKNIYSVQ